MNYEEIDLGIATLINQKSELTPIFAQPACATHIPFMGSREHFFILINIYVKSDWIEREKQVNDSLAIVRIVIHSGLLQNEKGIEVAAWSGEQNKRSRVVRLSVLRSAYETAMNLQGADVLDKQHEGITCHWPLQHPKN